MCMDTSLMFRRNSPSLGGCFAPGGGTLLKTKETRERHWWGGAAFRGRMNKSGHNNTMDIIPSEFDKLRLNLPFSPVIFEA